MVSVMKMVHATNNDSKDKIQYRKLTILTTLEKFDFKFEKCIKTSYHIVNFLEFYLS